MAGEHEQTVAAEDGRARTKHDSRGREWRDGECHSFSKDTKRSEADAERDEEAKKMASLLEHTFVVIFFSFTEYMSHPGFRDPKPGREHKHQVCWDQVSHI
jgi:hypothetical protein